MAISEALLDRAMTYDRAAMEAVLADVYPAVFRVANALTGRPGAGRLVLNDVLRRSLRVMPTWRRGTVPENWYYHHTVITARQAAPQPPDLRDDLLVKQGADSPAYLAFVRALRALPRQQSEAFLLHHGERLNTRLLGVSMDSSQQAATEHLRSADAAMAAVGGDATAALTAALVKAYASLVPPDNTVRPTARKYVAKHERSRVLRRVGQLLVLLVLLAAGYLLWLSRGQLREMLRPYLDTSPTTQPATQP